MNAAERKIIEEVLEHEPKVRPFAARLERELIAPAVSLLLQRYTNQERD